MRTLHLLRTCKRDPLSPSLSLSCARSPARANLRPRLPVGDQSRGILSWVANTPRSSYYMLNVNGHNLYRLNYPLRLNKWYHSCQSWNGRTGEWQIWVNDERVGRGFNNRVSTTAFDPYLLSLRAFFGGIAPSGRCSESINWNPGRITEKHTRRPGKATSRVPRALLATRRFRRLETRPPRSPRDINRNRATRRRATFSRVNPEGMETRIVPSGRFQNAISQCDLTTHAPFVRSRHPLLTEGLNFPTVVRQP